MTFRFLSSAALAAALGAAGLAGVALAGSALGGPGARGELARGPAVPAAEAATEPEAPAWDRPGCGREFGPPPPPWARRGGGPGRPPPHGSLVAFARDLAAAEVVIGIRAGQADLWRDFTDALLAVAAPPSALAGPLPPAEGAPFALVEAVADHLSATAGPAEALRRAIAALKGGLTADQLARVPEVEPLLAAALAPPPPPFFPRRAAPPPP